MASSAAVGLPEVVAFRSWAEAWSRIFAMAALRLGFEGGIGGGGVVLFGRERRVRWRVLRVVRVESREEGEECCEEVDMALEAGSRESGRRVNVSEVSILGKL